MIRRPAEVAAAVVLATVPIFGGCLAYKVVTTPVKLAATTVVVTGETAGAAVAATGKVAVSAFDAAGRMGSGGIDSASRLATSGMVTFMDVGTGTVVRVPWREGFTVASAGAEARVQLLSRAVDVVRSGAVIFSAKRLADGGAALAAGDVVRVRG